MGRVRATAADLFLGGERPAHGNAPRLVEIAYFDPRAGGKTKPVFGFSGVTRV